jgi:hypothetical protein
VSLSLSASTTRWPSDSLVEGGHGARGDRRVRGDHRRRGVQILRRRGVAQLGLRQVRRHHQPHHPPDAVQGARCELCSPPSPMSDLAPRTSGCYWPSVVPFQWGRGLTGMRRAPLDSFNVHQVKSWLISAINGRVRAQSLSSIPLTASDSGP